MANVFINLPAPAANGAGAWVDCGAMGANRTLVVGGALIGTVTIEISNEAAASKGAPVKSFNRKGQATIEVAAKWMRAVVSGYKSGGAPEVDVGSDDQGTQILNLVAPPAAGSGAAADSSAQPLVKTVTVGGPFKGTVIIEYSEDGGTTWATWCSFTNPGQLTKTFAAEWMRVTRSGIPAAGAPGTPLVDIGASQGGGGASPSFGDPEIVRYVAVGGETDFTVNFAIARPTDLYDVFPGLQGVASIVGIDTPDVIAGDRTVAGFRVKTSGALTVGDILSFLVANR